jgi:hypothetical protein
MLGNVKDQFRSETVKISFIYFLNILRVCMSAFDLFLAYAELIYELLSYLV